MTLNSINNSDLKAFDSVDDYQKRADSPQFEPSQQMEEFLGKTSTQEQVNSSSRHR